MDFCDMGSLADVLNTSLLRHHAGKVAMPAILYCLLEVASALHYLHSIGEGGVAPGRGKYSAPQLGSPYSRDSGGSGHSGTRGRLGGPGDLRRNIVCARYWNAVTVLWYASLRWEAM